MFIHLARITDEEIKGLEEAVDKLARSYRTSLELRWEPDKSSPRGVAILGDTKRMRDEAIPYLQNLDGVAEVMAVDTPYKLLSRVTHPEYNGGLIRNFSVDGVEVGGEKPLVIAGPCAVHSLEQTMQIAYAAREAGADMLRGGAYKPRTSPHSFRGLGEQGLEILALAKERTGLPIVTELLRQSDIPLFLQYGVDVIQIGMRNGMNYELIEDAGAAGLPILLKRNHAATFEEWILAAEYVANQGNYDIMLCERGMKPTDGSYHRNHIDYDVVSAAHRATFLPVIVDPSHGTGHAHYVPEAVSKAIISGANGVEIDLKRNGDLDLGTVDFPQAITLDQFSLLMRSAIPKAMELRELTAQINSMYG